MSRANRGRQRKNDRFLRFKEDERTINMDDNSIAKSKSNVVQSIVKIYNRTHLLNKCLTIVWIIYISGPTVFRLHRYRLGKVNIT